jgi:hypothetical protein
LVRRKWRGGKGRGGEVIFLTNYVWFNFNEGKGGERRRAKSLIDSFFASLQIGGI